MSLEVHLVYTLRNIRVVYGNICVARFEWCFYNHTSWRDEYLYDLFDLIEGGEDVKNDLVCGQLSKYFQKYPFIYPVKECNLPDQFEPDTFFVVKFYDNSDDDSPVKRKVRRHKKKRKLVETSASEDESEPTDDK